MDINRAYKILSNKHDYEIPWGPGSPPFPPGQAARRLSWAGIYSWLSRSSAHHELSGPSCPELGEWWKTWGTFGGINDGGNYVQPLVEIMSNHIQSELGQIMLVNRMGWSIIVLSLVDSPTLGDAEGTMAYYQHELASLVCVGTPWKLACRIPNIKFGICFSWKCWIVCS